MYCVREVNRLEELAPYRGAWRTLLAETAGASFFQSLDWLEAYWRHFGAGQKLRALVVLSDEEPAGIVPLAVRWEWTKVGRLRLLGYPLHDWGSFYGPIGPNPGEILTAALKHLRATRRDWDILELRWLGAGGTDPAETGRAMRAAGFQACRTVWDRTAVIEFDGTWDDYLAGRSSRWRNEFRRRQRRLAAQGRLSLLRYRPAGRVHGEANPRWDLYDACEMLAAKSWQAATNNGTTLSDPWVRPFLRELHAAAAAAGAVDLNLLLLDGRPLAFAYNYHWRGRVYGLRTGYDPAWARQGVGSLLCGLMIGDSFRRGDRLFDLGAGSLDGKRHLQTRTAPVFRYSHYHPTTLRAQLLRLKRWAEGRRLQAQEV